MTPEQEKKLNDAHDKLSRIELALLGDDLGSIGLVDRLIKNEGKISGVNNKVDNHIKSYEARENKRKGILIALAAAWSAIIVLINKIT